MLLLRQLFVTVSIITVAALILFLRVRPDGVEFRLPVTYGSTSCDTYVFLEWTTNGMRKGSDQQCT